MSHEAFVTGSQKYGSPNKDSDIDLVVFLDSDDILLLADTFLPDDPGYGDVLVLRFDTLNLICFSDEKKYEAWKQGTAECYEKRPVTREVAVSTIKALLQGRKLTFPINHEALLQ